MEYLQSILLGFQASLQPINLLYCFIGVFIGTLIGVLPGIGPGGTMALLIPVTYSMPPLSSTIMLTGVYYGAMYGGSITSILVNIPGEAASIVTCLDGYQMARQGRAGPALGISAFGSFIAGTVGIVGLRAISFPLTRLALKFGPPEYFSLIMLGLIMVAYIGQKSFLKSLIMGTLGLLIGNIGLDNMSGQERFTIGIDELLDGVGIIPMVMGLFGIAEILGNIETITTRSIFQTHVRGLFPSLEDWARCKWAIARGTIIGFFLGILPGGGAVLASFISYGVEKKSSKHPEEFGKGAIEGVAGPESANNAASSSAFIPLLALGIPSNVIMAILFAGLLIHGLQPGPLLIKEHPDVFWGIITSMYVGNVMLLILNLPLIAIWVRIIRIPFHFLFPVITIFCIIGAYSNKNSVFDVGLMFFFGVCGYIMRKYDFEPAPLVLAYVLGPMLEQALRRSLIMSRGDFTIFFTRPISVGCILVCAGLLLVSLVKYIRRKTIIHKMDRPVY